MNKEWTTYYPDEEAHMEKANKKDYQRIFSKFENFDEYRKWAKEWDKARKKVKRYCK